MKAEPTSKAAQIKKVHIVFMNHLGKCVTSSWFVSQMSIVKLLTTIAKLIEVFQRFIQIIIIFVPRHAGVSRNEIAIWVAG